jgi:hypothetical protein
LLKTIAAFLNSCTARTALNAVAIAGFMLTLIGFIFTCNVYWRIKHINKTIKKAKVIEALRNEYEIIRKIIDEQEDKPSGLYLYEKAGSFNSQLHHYIKARKANSLRKRFNKLDKNDATYGALKIILNDIIAELEKDYL